MPRPGMAKCEVTPRIIGPAGSRGSQGRCRLLCKDPGASFGVLSGPQPRPDAQGALEMPWGKDSRERPRGRESPSSFCISCCSPRATVVASCLVFTQVPAHRETGPTEL